MKTNKRTLFEIETMALSMGLGGTPVIDNKLCNIICKEFREAYIKHDVFKIHEILSLYILEFKLLDVDDMTYFDGTGILLKYEPKMKNLHFALEAGPSHDIRIDSVKDFEPIFDSFETGKPDLLFTTCMIYTNEF